MFSSVNLNSEFSYFQKMGWRLRAKKFVYYGCSPKNLIFRFSSQIYIYIYMGDFLKKEGLDSLQM